MANRVHVSRIAAKPMFSHEQYDALQSGAALVDRSHRGRLRLSGEDRRAYLQGLLTNDIAALTAGTGCYAALLTPQGRMISDLRVSELGHAILIDLPDSTSERVRQRLEDFIFAEDVEVRDVTSTLAQFGLYGPRSAEVLARLGDGTEAADDPRQAVRALPADGNVRWSSRGVEVVAVASDDYGVAGFELFFDAATAPALAVDLREGGALDVTADTLEVVRVEAGRPKFGVDMDEHTIPLEAGIEDRAISLTKGCYVGQEVIIRVLHRGHGKVAKHLVGLSADVRAGDLHRGDRLHRDGKEVGIVTSAVRSPALQRPIALGYVHRDHVEPGTRLRIDGSATELTVVSLPFTSSAGG